MPSPAEPQPAARSAAEGGAAPVSAVERMLRSLLQLRGVADTERAVVAGARECTGAAWAACYRSEAGALVCTAVEGPGPVIGAVLAHVPALLRHEVGGSGVATEYGVRATPGAELALPLDTGPEDGALLLLGPRDEEGTSAYPSIGTLARVGDAASVALRNAALIDRLRSQAALDFLTGCYNRRSFEERLHVEIVRARRYRRPMALLLVDLDHFKRINDELGHPVGDHALRRLGALLLGAFRTTDVVCRFGGDEFAVIFPETTKPDATRLATRLRRQVGVLFPDGTIPLAVTASFGVACYPEDGTETDELVRATDHALYRAKSEGRNRVVSA